jgi:rhodanese-related sulfurtransferase/transcriptional regulator with XRE-family HTH domain
MKLIAPTEVAALLAAGSYDLVDVREPAEWATGHLPGARLLPLSVLRAGLPDSLPADRVIFVCAKGGRSTAAAQLAEAAGHREVYSVAGGTEGWLAANLPLTVPRPATPLSSAHPTASSESPPAGPVDEQLLPELEALVAENLRAQRKKRGLSLDELAGEAGVSRTLLGQLELGKASPTVRVIWKLAQALGVPFATLLSTESNYGTTVSHRATAKPLQSADGRFTSRALFRLGEADAAEFYELRFAPHSREEAEPHRPGTRENLVVSAGRLELRIGSERVLLDAGDAVNFAADIPHVYINPGSEECWAYLVMNYQKE